MLNFRTSFFLFPSTLLLQLIVCLCFFVIFLQHLLLFCSSWFRFPSCLQVLLFFIFAMNLHGHFWHFYFHIVLFKWLCAFWPFFLTLQEPSIQHVSLFFWFLVDVGYTCSNLWQIFGIHNIFLHDFHVSFFTFINVVVCMFKNHVICVFVFSQIKVGISIVLFQVWHKLNYSLICEFFWILIVSYDENLKNS